MIGPFIRPVLALAAALVLSGCESARDLIVGTPDGPPLEGERLPVMAQDADLEVSLPPGRFQPRVPPARRNDNWLGAGGPANNQPGHLALSPNTLSRAWSATIGTGSGSDQRLVSSPIVAFGIAYTMDAESEVSAFDASGRRLWRTDTTPEGEGDALPGGLAFGGDKLIATSGYGVVYALDPATGAIVWQRETGAPSRSAPTVADDRVFIQTIDGQVIALSVADGVPLWAFTGMLETAALLQQPSPAVEGRLLAVGLASGELSGLRVENGRLIWSEAMTGFRSGAGGLASLPGIAARPVIDSNQVIAVGNDNRLSVLTAATGRRFWQQRIGSIQTPAVTPGGIFVVDRENRVIAVARETGDVAWITQLRQFEDEEDREDPLRWFGPLLAGDGLLVLSSIGELVRLDPATGEIRSTQSLDLRPAIRPIVAGATLYVVSQSGALSAWR